MPLTSMSAIGRMKWEVCMMGFSGFKSKADVKRRIADATLPPLSASGRFVETSMFGAEYKGDGTYVVVGPDPYVRKWYGQVTVKDGNVVKIT